MGLTLGKGLHRTELSVLRLLEILSKSELELPSEIAKTVPETGYAMDHYKNGAIPMCFSVKLSLSGTTEATFFSVYRPPLRSQDQEC